MENVIYNDLEEIYNSRNSWDVLDQKTVLLTGPYGMLASYLVLFFYYLVEYRGLKIRLIAVGRSEAKFTRKFSEYKLQEKNWVRFVESDLINEIKIDEPVDYIIHAASLASPQYYETCPVDVLIPNTLGCYNMLKLAVEKQVKGFLLFSTGDIYGRVDDVTCIDESVVGKLDTLNIHNCYSESKRMAETMCNSFYVQFQVPIKIARIWHTYAPTMDIHNDPRVFASFTKNIIEGRNIEMKSDGAGKRCFCYISDAVSGYLKILIDGEPGEAYNVCNESQYVSVLELAEIMVRLKPEKELKVVRVNRDSDEHYSENILLKGVEAVPSSEKLRSLGWNPKVDIYEGFKRVVMLKDKQQ